MVIELNFGSGLDLIVKYKQYYTELTQMTRICQHRGTCHVRIGELLEAVLPRGPCDSYVTQQ